MSGGPKSLLVENYCSMEGRQTIHCEVLSRRQRNIVCWKSIKMGGLSLSSGVGMRDCCNVNDVVGKEAMK